MKPLPEVSKTGVASEYYAFVRKHFPRPTRQMIVDFVEMMQDDHSWYKHISFREPTDFRVCMNDAISWCRLDYCFTNDVTVNERLRAQYRNKYGFLSYRCGAYDESRKELGIIPRTYLDSTWLSRPVPVPRDAMCIRSWTAASIYEDDTPKKWADDIEKWLDRVYV
jgi:hypothetical protein